MPHTYVENYKEYSENLNGILEEEELDFVKRSLQVLLEETDDVSAKLDDFLALTYVTDVLKHADTFYTRPTSFRNEYKYDKLTRL